MNQERFTEMSDASFLEKQMKPKKSFEHSGDRAHFLKSNLSVQSAFSMNMGNPNSVLRPYRQLFKLGYP